MQNSTNSDREFLKGVRPSTFLSTPEELHALVIGLCEVLCPWPPGIRLPSGSRTRTTDTAHGEDDNLNRIIHSEYHYYLLGRALGVIAWLIIATILKEVFF
jgi:hypothetical protein